MEHPGNRAIARSNSSQEELTETAGSPNGSIGAPSSAASGAGVWKPY